MTRLLSPPWDVLLPAQAFESNRFERWVCWVFLAIGVLAVPISLTYDIGGAAPHRF